MPDISTAKWVIPAFLSFLLLSPPAHTEPEQSETTPSSSSSAAYKKLKRAVRTSESASSYRLRVTFSIDTSDREDTITIRSEGDFRKPYFRLLSETPAGMEVKSFGKTDSVVHIHPSTDEVVTSDELGISSVNRTLLDPFEHMAYLVKPGYEGFGCSVEGTERIDNGTYRVLRVQAGTEQVREVMNEFRDQLNRPLRPRKTTAVYRILYDEETDLIRRVRLNIDSEFVSKPSEDTSDEDLKEELPELPEKPDKNQSTKGPVKVHVKGQFELNGYGEVSNLAIPDDVERKLQQLGAGQ